MNDNSSRVIEVDINEILPNRFQPRIQFDENEILELSDSIKEHGVIQPIVVRTIGDKYEIIAGERRYKASVLAGKETVPVIIKNLNDKDSAEIALIENIQRKNLTPIEEALSYKKILDMGYITQENLAAKLGKSQSSVANKIRLLNLSDEVQEALLENKISERHARSLLKLSTSKLQNKMLEKIISERLTVRKTDEEIEKVKNQSENILDEQKEEKIEKGEIDMNNSVNNIPQSTITSFDIFGEGNTQPVNPVMTETNPIVTPSPGFDIFGGVNQSSMPTIPEVQPVVEPEVQSIPEMPQSEPTFSPMGGFGFDLNGMMQPVVPEVPVMPTIPEIQPVVEPEVQSMPEMPQSEPTFPPMGGFGFDLNGMMQPVAPEVPVMPTIPEVQPVVEPEVQSMPEMPQPSIQIPPTSPIIETPNIASPVEMTNQSENLFSFGDNSINPVKQPEIQSIPEFKIPEPIIITDYSKQYDPIMPQPELIEIPQVDFKEVINAIRECSSKIEKYGFRIDVEEYDLTNLYQVIFKIEK